MRRKRVVVALGVVAQIAMAAAQGPGWQARSETVAQAAKNPVPELVSALLLEAGKLT